MNKKYLELKIQLLDIKPSVYRTIQISADATFFDLHVSIQFAFDWENSHLHSFMVNDKEIGNLEMDEFGEMDILDQSEIQLKEFLVFEKQKCIYIYDFGDNWEHEITLMKFIEPNSSYYPKCVRGARNRPPEDCGGVWGFEQFKEIMGSRKHPEFKEMKAWYGGMFDEEYFDKSAVNSKFQEFETFKHFMYEAEY